MTPEVSIVRGIGITRTVRKALELIGGVKNVVRPGDRVLIKPNLVVPLPPDRAATTSPEVVKSVIECVKEADAGEIIVADAPFFFYRARDAFQRSGLMKVVEELGVRVAYLDEEKYVKVSVPDGFILREVQLPKIFLDSDVFITVPKMKTHLMTKVSLGMKNQIGLLTPEEKKIAHREDINQKIVDVLRVAKPDLTLIDGFLAAEGQGPTYGSPVGMNVILAGRDVVAVDAVCAYIMGFNPSAIPTIRFASLNKLGESDLTKIQVKGIQMNSVKRKFKRSSAELVGLYKNINVYIGGACRLGCMAWTRAALDGLQRRRILDKAEEFNLILGVKPLVPKYLKGETFVIGNCAEEFRDRGVFIPGCPPFEVIHQLMK